MSKPFIAQNRRQNTLTSLIETSDQTNTDQSLPMASKPGDKKDADKPKDHDKPKDSDKPKDHDKKDADRPRGAIASIGVESSHPRLGGHIV
jgi:hypothetical protein